MKDFIDYQDFAKLDIRVGKVVQAHDPEWSNKLLEFTVDFGENIGTKTILSGIKKWYKPEDFIDNNYLFIVNLKERKMGKSVSQGMMLMIDENDKPRLIQISAEVTPGTIIA